MEKTGIKDKEKVNGDNDAAQQSGSPVQGTEQKPGAERATWSKQLEFTLAGIGCAVGLGNVWRFPYLCYRSGGGAFLIPYLLMLALVGIPLLYMELTIGQYIRFGPVHAMAKVCPLLKGVGMSTMMMSFLMCTYYNLIITWALYYLFSSFQSPLPWQSCNNSWNIPENCSEYISNSSFATTASQQFFNYKVLQKSDSIDNLGTVRWELILLLLLAWILIYLCLFKGVRLTGKIVYFTAIFPYIILLAFLINNVQLPGALEGIKFYIVPEWERLTDIQVWVNAAAQIFNSIGIAFGSLMAMASYNQFNNNILKDTLAISLINSATSIFAGFVIFSAFGYMSYIQNVPVTDIAVDGPALVFVVYPQAFSTMSVAPLWAVLFFFMLLCLGIDSEFAMVEVMITSLMDGIGSWLLKYLKYKEVIVLVVCLAAFCMGIPNITQGGIYVFQLLDHYNAIIALVFIAFFEVVAICWFYGVKRLSQNVMEMTGKKPNIFLRACWLIISPAFVIVILIFNIIKFSPARYGDYVFPDWAQGIGWFIFLFSVIWIPLGAIHSLWMLNGSLWERLCKSITPFALDEALQRRQQEETVMTNQLPDGSTLYPTQITDFGKADAFANNSTYM
ncbi:sodium- and chloride-dependent GABA transporter ine-like [Protopterus annectens]|uniref:sodium- and chloride-dependent GABA transporter ine-like n=1 Tax=Protopterus annectens TaxID=7888 RepID=UPI001CFA13A7|nr:sodium- and chloride-dependent GABA transporter ine-like [Protopterus annectens]